ncbi:hypothetical protein ABH935_006316 [Catenulispora sp. GAS73]|uniref:Pvc16 family protein n=1 Tax=Catenulispora sp. GAS73 TaxID=3156269 RepID=UPI003519BC51
MSNFLAVATATEALRLFIVRALTPDIPFAVNVTSGRPPAEPPAEPTITVFLYQVTPDPYLRNLDEPMRASDGTLLSRPVAALDLSYLITFFGDETQLVPQRMLGCVVRSLYELPMLTDDLIAEAAQMPFLAGTDLPAAPQRIRFTPTHMDTEELSKLWSFLLQTSYTLSVTYQAAAVLLDGRETPTAGKPVLSRTLTAVPSTGPQISEILSRPTSDPGAVPQPGPVPSGNTLVVRGSGLKSDEVLVRFDALEVPVPANQVRDTELTIAVPATLQPGTYTVSVVHNLLLGVPPTPHRGFESNGVPIVRQPTITGAVTVTGKTGTDPVSAQLGVTLDMPVGDTQRVSMLLDEITPAAGTQPRSYQFDAPYPVGTRTNPQTVTVQATNVAATSYLVRVQVDGAQSPLAIGASGHFDSPSVDLGAAAATPAPAKKAAARKTTQAPSTKQQGS